jgi:cytosine/creatinine deaminase
LSVALLLRGCRLPDGSTADVLVRDGRIATLHPTADWQGPVVDANHRLLTPGLTDPHLHPDKAFGLEVQSAGANSRDEAIARVRAQKAEQTAEQICARTVRLMEWCLSFGTTRARVHAEVDPLLGLRSVEGVLRAREALEGRVHLQVVAFPQEGISKEPGTADLLREAMRLGCDVVGAITYQDADPRAHLEFTANLAREFGAPLDVHIDFGVPVRDSALVLLADVARATGVRALAGHATTLAHMDDPRRAEVLEKLRDAGVAVCALPRTDLFMEGCVAPLRTLREAGVQTCLGTNNVLNAFTPVGRPSLPSVACVYALTARISQRSALHDLAESLWTAATCIGLPAPVIREGAPADLCLWPCDSAWQIVATEAQPDLVLVAGEVVHA